MVRRLLDRITWLVEHLSAAVVLWVPSLLLLALGILYLGQAVALLLAPGAPVEFPYDATGGKFVLRAESLSIDPWRLRADINGISLTNPKGVREAWVKHATASYDHGAVKTRVAGGWVKVVRSPEEAFSILQALPPQEEGGPSTPVTALVEDVTVDYVDITEMPRIAQRIIVKRVQVDSADGSGRGFGTATVGGVPMQISGLWKSTGYWQGHSKFPEGQFAWALPHVRRWLDLESRKQIADLKLGSLSASGEATLEGMPDKTIHIWANAAYEAHAVRFEPWVQNGSTIGSIELGVNQARTVAKLEDGGRKASFDGILDWAQEFTLFGQATAQVANKTDIWAPVARLIPKNVTAQNTRFAGTVFWNGKDYDLRGNVNANRVAYEGFRGDSIQAVSQFTSKGFRLKQLRGKIGQANVSGSIGLDYGPGKLMGFVQTNRETDLAWLAKQAGLEGLRGQAKVKVALGGTAKNPQMALQAQGNAAYRIQDQDVRLGRFSVSASLTDNVVSVSQFSSNGPVGRSVVQGTANLKSKALNFGVLANAESLGEFVDGIDGSGSVAGKLTGTIDNPAFAGRAHATGLKSGDTLVADSTWAEVAFKKGKLELNDIVVNRQNALVRGSVAMDLSSKALSGKVDMGLVALQDFVSPDVALGSLMVGDGLISGTLDHPKLTARVESPIIASGEIPITALAGKLEITKDKARLTDATLSALNGTVSFSSTTDLTGDFDTVFSGTASGINLAALTNRTSDLELAGLIGGNFSASIQNGQLRSGKSSLAITGLKAGGATIGSGDLGFTADPNQWLATISLGNANSFIISDGLAYDPKTKALKGSLDVLDLPLQEFFGSDLLLGNDPNPDLALSLEHSNGLLTAGMKLGGTSDQPSVEVASLGIRDIVLDGQPFGALKATGSYDAAGWAVKGLDWRFGEGAVLADVTAARDGKLSGSAQIEDFDFSILHEFRPNFPKIEAKGGAQIELSGNTSDPVVEASTTPIIFDLGSHEESADLLLDSIHYEAGLLTGSGKFSVYGVGGTITARVPMEALDSNNLKAAPFEVGLNVERQKLVSLARFLPELDPNRLSGRVSAGLALSGTAAGYRLDGSANLDGGFLSSRDLSTALSNVDVQARLNGNRVDLTASGQGSQGGSITANVRADLADFLRSDFDSKRFLSDSGIRGSITVDQFKVKEFQDQPDKALRATVSTGQGGLTFGGSLASPEIAGSLILTDVDAALASSEEEASPPEFAFNPIFKDVEIIADQPVAIKTSSVNVRVTGTGTVSGSLNRPVATAPMKLVSGVFRLPNARVTLEPDGQMNFRYDGNRPMEQAARLDLNLEGRTAITALKYGTFPERYDVTLSITGNLLQDGGLNLFAQSQPPELSSQEILALLGQKALIEDLARGLNKTRDPFLRDTALTLATPYLTGNITQSIANTFKIDYLGIDYNAFEGATFTASDALGKGLVLTWRRQLVENANRKRLQEIRLTWRVPSRDPFLSKLRLGFGMDQDRPWKFSLDYTIRF
ncbi:MAG: hypothetical protein JST40_01535 [Armatimonadetes bacterium]|nr:hypothetical protein [Armatimonadota bacterium]